MVIYASQFRHFIELSKIRMKFPECFKQHLALTKRGSKFFSVIFDFGILQ